MRCMVAIAESRPKVTSSSAALSRTIRVRAWSVASPPPSLETVAPVGTLARVGFKPNKPQQDGGILIDPPPSLALAIGAILAAALPPEEPSAARSSP